MADPAELVLVKAAITSGVTGCCEWDDDEIERVRSDPSLQGLTPEYLRERLCQLVAKGGAVKQVPEKRPQYSHRKYYYKAILPESGFKYGLFVEMELIDPDPDLPCVSLLNAHPQGR